MNPRGSGPWLVETWVKKCHKRSLNSRRPDKNFLNTEDMLQNSGTRAVSWLSNDILFEVQFYWLNRPGGVLVAQGPRPWEPELYPTRYTLKFLIVFPSILMRCWCIFGVLVRLFSRYIIDLRSCDLYYASVCPLTSIASLSFGTGVFEIALDN